MHERREGRLADQRELASGREARKRRSSGSTITTSPKPVRQPHPQPGAPRQLGQTPGGVVVRQQIALRFEAKAFGRDS